jgi:hypothetical protein
MANLHPSLTKVGQGSSTTGFRSELAVLRRLEQVLSAAHALFHSAPLV